MTRGLGIGIVQIKSGAPKTTVATPARWRPDPRPGDAGAPEDSSTGAERTNRINQRIFETSLDLILVVSRVGELIRVSPSSLAILGYAPEELVGQLATPYVHPADLESTRVEMRLARRGQETRNFLCRYVHKSGQIIPLSWTGVWSEPEQQHFFIGRDISERLAAEQVLRDAVRERDLLLGEIHHRVKNNLQVIDALLDLQVPLVQDPDVVSVLRDAQNRVRSMSLIHETLYQSNDFARLDFAGFLDALVPILVISYGDAARPDRVTVTIDAEEVLLPIDRAVPCGLVVNELVTNSFKHAFPNDRQGTITVTIRRLEADPGHGHDRALLAVTDDGVGLPPDLDPTMTESLGLNLVHALTDQLGATLAIDRQNPTRFALTLSLAPN